MNPTQKNTHGKIKDQIHVVSVFLLSVGYYDGMALLWSSNRVLSDTCEKIVRKNPEEKTQTLAKLKFVTESEKPKFVTESGKLTLTDGTS